ncbi:MAG: FKBP-type peptidyl-prolyl cis-trans isomerase [Saprospiraceae bacterium]|nr:FKBP-type peptidyl-prolyl cis-trans isomerase [Saprospiraceae bacterium]
MKFYCLITAIMGLTLAGCKKEDMGQENDDVKIQNYLEENNITADKHESGLYYNIQKSGDSSRPNVESTVEVRYKGTLLDGTVFDQTQGSSTVSFPLNRLITAWQIGIPLIGKGGSITLYCPSELGYGSNRVGSIPANSVLIFEIDLVSFND